jgi:hypothetical protein
MARTEPTVLVTTRAGVAFVPTAVAAADDCMFVNTGVELVYVWNASGSTANLVFETPATLLSEALALADATATVGTGAGKLFGPFPTTYFNQPSGADAGKLYLNTDQAISVLVVRLGSIS